MPPPPDRPLPRTTEAAGKGCAWRGGVAFMSSRRTPSATSASLRHAFAGNVVGATYAGTSSAGASSLPALSGFGDACAQ